MRQSSSPIQRREWSGSLPTQFSPSETTDATRMEATTPVKDSTRYQSTNITLPSFKDILNTHHTPSQQQSYLTARSNSSQQLQQQQQIHQTQQTHNRTTHIYSNNEFAFNSSVSKTVSSTTNIGKASPPALAEQTQSNKEINWVFVSPNSNSNSPQQKTASPPSSFINNYSGTFDPSIHNINSNNTPFNLATSALPKTSSATLPPPINTGAAYSYSMNTHYSSPNTDPMGGLWRVISASSSVPPLSPHVSPFSSQSSVALFPTVGQTSTTTTTQQITERNQTETSTTSQTPSMTSSSSTSAARSGSPSPVITVRWMKHYASLKEFQAMFKHCNVSRKVQKWKTLGHWVGQQRRKRKLGKLSEKQIDMLDELGFEWDRSYYLYSKLPRQQPISKILEEQEMEENSRNTASSPETSGESSGDDMMASSTTTTTTTSATTMMTRSTAALIRASAEVDLEQDDE